tara:strand:- start:150 stop:440 length:291 start_codon:yes stop_codon:yes gene_type:complete
MGGMVAIVTFASSPVVFRSRDANGDIGDGSLGFLGRICGDVSPLLSIATAVLVTMSLTIPSDVTTDIPFPGLIGASTGYTLPSDPTCIMEGGAVEL